MFSYMNQEGNKHNWTPCESEIMHFVYSGIGRGSNYFTSIR